MLLFPADGVLEDILMYGQLISIFLVLFVFEAVVAAKSEKAWPGLLFVFVVFCLAVGVGIGFGDINFFFVMLPSVLLCLLAFFIARKTRAKNIAKGLEYNKDGLIEDELKKMQQ